jgi:aspartate/methionine/tyrosine aminotransferase
VLAFALGGLSKACGLPQMKLSWIAVDGPLETRTRALAGLEWISDLFLSVSTPVQLALPGWLERRHAFQTAVRERIADNRATPDGDADRRPELDLITADGGWVQPVRLPGRLDDLEWALRLLEQDVIVHPAHFYDFDREATVVVSLIVEPASFATGLARIAEAIQSV